MAIVYVKETCGVGTDGGVVHLRRGDAWDTGAELVKAHPGLFEAEPTKVHGRVERATSAPVERATSAPGEQRETRIPVKKSAPKKKP